nr:MAG TPA: hypothetical protein [Caudoviricetes sp.]
MPSTPLYVRVITIVVYIPVMSYTRIVSLAVYKAFLPTCVVLTIPC